METETLKELGTILTSLGALLAGILGLVQYLKTRRDKLRMVREDFDAVVASLASEIEVKRAAGAILLRRFYDPKTEVGLAGTPYWKEAVNVTAAILRDQGTSNFQKLLADGLAFAPSLERADLQKTNLQFAYLGYRKKAAATGLRDRIQQWWERWCKSSDQETTNLRHADFYRADLSNASLKQADAREAVFYQARMHNTVLSGANLENANFFEADVKGVRFARAHLFGADFSSALNLPPDIRANLDKDGKYSDREPFPAPAFSPGPPEIRVFISKPGCLDHRQQQQVSSLTARLEAEGMTPQSLERSAYPRFNPIGEIERIMSGCAGAVIFGFEQLEVRDGLWRAGTSEEKHIHAMTLSSPWNQIEAGMAVMLGLPVLICGQPGVGGGIFDLNVGGDRLHRVQTDETWDAAAFVSSFTNWCATVRERSRQA